MMVCTVLIWFILTVLQESSNLDAIFIVCRKIKNKISKLVFSPTPPPFWSKANFLIFFLPFPYAKNQNVENNVTQVQVEYVQIYTTNSRGRNKYVQQSMSPLSVRTEGADT